MASSSPAALARLRLSWLLNLGWWLEVAEAVVVEQVFVADLKTWWNVRPVAAKVGVEQKDRS